MTNNSSILGITLQTGTCLWLSQVREYQNNYIKAPTSLAIVAFNSA